MTVAIPTYPNVSDANVSDELEAILRSPVDERAARATLRQQIARLEQELAALTFDLWQAGRSRVPSEQSGAVEPTGGRLLGVGELEGVRDALIERIDSGRRVLTERAETQSRARAHLQEMLADPATHRFHVVQRADLGEPSCGAYQVRPRLGLLGMLFGWWCVKLSSGCPLSMYHQSNHRRREHLLLRKQARLELVVAVVVVFAVVATIAAFLLIYHDFPFRLSGAA